MAALFIRHRVRDFDAWRQVFLEDAETRRANGSQREWLYRNAADPKEAWILLQWDNLFCAQLYVRSDDLLDAQARSGVIDHPDYWYLEDVDAFTP